MHAQGGGFPANMVGWNGETLPEGLPLVLPSIWGGGPSCERSVGQIVVLDGAPFPADGLQPGPQLRWLHLGLRWRADPPTEVRAWRGTDQG